MNDLIFWTHEVFLILKRRKLLEKNKMNFFFFLNIQQFASSFKAKYIRVEVLEDKTLSNVLVWSTFGVFQNQGLVYICESLYCNQYY